MKSWPGRALYYFHHASIANTSRSKLKLTWGSRVSDWLQGPWGCDVRLHVASPKIHSGLARSFHPAPAPLEGEIAHAGGTGESFYAFLSGPLSTPDGSPQASLSVRHNSHSGSCCGRCIISVLLLPRLSVRQASYIHCHLGGVDDQCRTLQSQFVVSVCDAVETSQPF